MKNFLANTLQNLVDFTNGIRQKHAAQKFADELLDMPSFFLLVLLSGMIAALGLVEANEPVVIGAMIITPFINPLAGVSLALFVRKPDLFWKAFWRATLGMVAFFGVAYLVGLFFSSAEMNESLLLRAKGMRVADFFIAIAAGLVTALALASAQIQSRITGAAIAISLAPPLAVAGIALSWQEWRVFQNALELFGINVAGILLMSAVVFGIFGFQQHPQDVVQES